MQRNGISVSRAYFWQPAKCLTHPDTFLDSSVFSVWFTIPSANTGSSSFFPNFRFYVFSFYFVLSRTASIMWDGNDNGLITEALLEDNLS